MEELAIKHDVVRVNTIVEDINLQTEKFNNISTEIEALTGAITSCNGFSMVASLSNGQYSAQIDECKKACEYVTNTIRKVQIEIMKYDQSEENLNIFLSSISDGEWEKLGMNVPKTKDGLAAFLSANKNDISDTLELLGVEPTYSGWDRFGAFWAVTGAKLLEGAAHTLETWADGVGTLFTLGGRALQLDTSGLEKWIAKEHVRDFATSIYENSDIFNASKGTWFSYDGTYANIVDTVGSALPYVVTSGLTSYKGITHVAGNTWGAYVKAGLGVAKKEMIFDTALGTLGGLGEGTSQGLQEGMNFSDAVVKEGLKSAGREFVIGAAGNVLGEVGGATLKYAKNNGIFDLANKGANAAAAKALDSIDGNRLIGVVDDVDDKLIKAVDASSQLKNLDEYTKILQSQGEQAVEETIKKNALNVFESGVSGSLDDAYKAAAKSGLTQELTESATKQIREEMTQQYLKNGITDEKFINRLLDAAESSGEISRKINTADIATKVDDMLKAASDGGVQLGKDAVAKSALDTAKRTDRFAADVGKYVDDGISSVLSKGDIGDLNKAAKQLQSGLTDTSNKLQQGLTDQLTDSRTFKHPFKTEEEKFIKNFGENSLDNAAANAKKALDDLLEDAARTGKNLTTSELQDAAVKAAKESIQTSTIVTGSKAAQTAYSTIDDNFAKQLDNYQKTGRINSTGDKASTKRGDFGNSNQPGLNNQAQLDINNRQQPELNNRQQPELNNRQQPELNNRQQPELNNRQQPELNNRQQPELNNRQQPELNNRQQPELNNRQQPEFSRAQQTDIKQPPNSNDVKWDQPEVKADTKGTPITETRGTDIQGRNVIKADAADGSSKITTTAKQGTNNIEIVENYNKSGVKTYQTTTTLDADGRVQERIVEGLDGKVVETRKWTSGDTYDAFVTKNDGTSFHHKETVKVDANNVPISKKVYDESGNLLKDVSTSSGQVKGSGLITNSANKIELPGGRKTIDLKAGEYLDPNTTVKTTTTTNYVNGQPRTTTKYEFSINKNGSTNSVKVTALEQADGTFSITKNLDDSHKVMEINHPKGKAPTIIDENFDKATGVKTTEVSRAGKESIKTTVAADGTKTIQKGKGANATTITETYDAQNMSKTRTTTQNGKMDSITEKYDPNTRTKTVTDSKGNVVSTKTYDKPTFDPGTKPADTPTPPKGNNTPPTDNNSPNSGGNNNTPGNNPPSSGNGNSPLNDSAGDVKRSKAGQFAHDNFTREGLGENRLRNEGISKAKRELGENYIKENAEKAARLSAEKDATAKALSTGLDLNDDAVKLSIKQAGDEAAEKAGKEALEKASKSQINRASKKALKEMKEQVGKKQTQQFLKQAGDNYLATRTSAQIIEAGNKELLKRGGITAAGLGLGGLYYLGSNQYGGYTPPIDPGTTDPGTNDPGTNDPGTNDPGTTYPPYNPGPSGGDDGGGHDGADTPPTTDDPDTPPDVVENPPEDTTPPDIVDNEGNNNNPGGGNNGNYNGGGNTWTPNGGGNSFDDNNTDDTLNNDDNLSDEDLSLGDDILNGSDDEDGVYTIPMTVGPSTSKVTKDGVNPIPILAGLGLAAAAGVGAKIYLDNKKNNDNGEDDDEYMDEDFDNDYGSTDGDLIADEWTEPNNEEKLDEGLDYERPSFYSDTLGDEI